MSDLIVIDIETMAQPNLAETLPPFDEASVKAGNIKDSEKLKAKIAEARANYVTDAIEQAPLSEFYGQVLAIGIFDVAHDAIELIHGYDETKNLGEFWPKHNLLRKAGQDATFVGLFSNTFDWPMLWKRSHARGLKPPRIANSRGYLFDWYVDLRMVWTFGDRQAYPSLDKIARCLGVGQKTGDGKDFAATYAKDQKAALLYLENDLRLEAELAKRLL